MSPADRFARLREEFHLPKDSIYLDGNSLGPASRRAEAAVHRVLREWRELAIGGWSHGCPAWLDLAELAASGVAELIGASADAVAVTGQTTANLHQLLATLFDPTRANRRCIVGDTLNFASDAYALHSHLRLRGLDPSSHLRLVPSEDGYLLDPDRLVAAFEPQVQLAVLPAVLFGSGQLLDIRALTQAAHARGVMIGWDLSHSIGVVPHTLEEDGADFAFWCSYKFLGAGPGAVGGLFLHPRHFGREPGLAGWWGVGAERRFAMARAHEPAAGAAALHIGTPHVLSLAPLLGVLELFSEAGGMAAIRKRSLELTEHLLQLVDEQLAGMGFRVVTPRGHPARGGHVALAHPSSREIVAALRAAGVIADWRTPDLVRLAPSPLFTNEDDLQVAVARLGEIASGRRHHAVLGPPPRVP